MDVEAMWRALGNINPQGMTQDEQSSDPLRSDEILANAKIAWEGKFRSTEDIESLPPTEKRMVTVAQKLDEANLYREVGDIRRINEGISDSSAEIVGINGNLSD